jgi:putative FmdB family regulatory protein
MPIFEYVCKDCHKSFEALVYGSKKPECPHCHGTHLDQLISVFSVGSGARHNDAPAAGGCCGGGACGFPGGSGGCGME